LPDSADTLPSVSISTDESAAGWICVLIDSSVTPLAVYRRG